MYKVLIDTTNRFEKSLRIIQIHENQVEKVVFERYGDLDIMGALEEWLKAMHISADEINQIKEFVPNPGPGSFTGIKSGITIANVGNWLLAQKLAPKKGEKQKDIRPKYYTPNYGKEPNIESRK